MDNLFLALLLLSIVGFFVGVVRPQWVWMASRKRAAMTFAGTAVVFFILFGVTSSPNSQGAKISIGSTQNATSSQTSVTGESNSAQVTNTPETALQNAVQAAFSSQGALSVSYKTGTVEPDDPPPTKPAGAQYVTIDMEVPQVLSSNEFITDSGTLTSRIFQRVFALDPNYYDVLVRYYGQTIDQYGNSHESMLMSYSMDRPLFSKINWEGFSSIGNDVRLCAFIRAAFESLSQSEKKNTYIGCIVMPRDLRTAEDSIENTNAQ